MLYQRLAIYFLKVEYIIQVMNSAVKDKWGVGSPLNLSLINSIPTETAKHLLNKNRDTNTHEIKMEALKLQYLSLSWNGESCFQLTNYIM